MTEDKSALMAALKKQFGDNFAFSGSKIKPLERLSTGIISLDIASGGGIPLGRSIELFGAYSIGKTTTALHILAAAQAKGLKTVYIDLEGTLEITHCVNAGVDLENLLVLNPTDGNETFDALKTLITIGEYNFFVIDSIPGLLPKSDLEKFQGDSDSKAVAGVASLFARQWPVLKEYGRQHNATFVFLNQVSAKIGPMAMGGLDTPGGWRSKHLMSWRINLKYKTAPKGLSKDVSGCIETHFVVEKSKVGGAGSEGTLLIERGKINKAWSLLTTSEELDLISRSGASYKLNEELATIIGSPSVGMGQAKACAALEANPKMWELLYTKCLEVALGLGTSADIGVKVKDEE